MNRGTLTVRVRGVPFPIEFADWTHDRLFHTIEFEGQDSNEILVFIGGVGSPIPGGSRVLTEVDTNIPRSGDTGLQEGWEMLIYSIQLEVTREMARNDAQQAFALQDSFVAAGANQWSRPAHVGGYDPTVTSGGVLFDFMRKTFHRFAVNQKVQSEGSVEKYPQGSGVSVFGTTTSLEVANNGVPSPRDQSAFVLPIWLRPNIAYVGKLRPQTALGIQGIAVGGAGPGAGTYVEGYQNWAPAMSVGCTHIGFDVKETLEGLLKRPVV
jgi:hypothetical protein